MDQLDRSWEPMDVDRSFNSTKQADTSKEDLSIKNNETSSYPPSDSVSTCEEQCKDTKQHVRTKDAVTKKFHIDMEKARKKGKSKKKTLVIFSLLSVAIAVFYSKYGLYCSTSVDIISVSEIFLNKLYGQTAIIETLAKSFEFSEQCKLIFLLGGTGVGKTYSTSLALHSMWNYSNVYHYTMPGLTSAVSNSLMVGFLMCKNSYIIVDGLISTDLDIAPTIKELVDKSLNLNRIVNIILIYNNDVTMGDFNKETDNYFEDKLKVTFSNINIEKQFIQFRKLEKQHLQKCIEDELIQGKYVFTNDLVEQLLDSFDVSVDGCKSVHRKVKGLNLQQITSNK